MDFPFQLLSAKERKKERKRERVGGRHEKRDKQLGLNMIQAKLCMTYNLTQLNRMRKKTHCFRKEKFVLPSSKGSTRK